MGRAFPGNFGEKFVQRRRVSKEQRDEMFSLKEKDISLSTLSEESGSSSASECSCESSFSKESELLN